MLTHAELSKRPDDLVHHAREHFDLPPALLAALDSKAGAAAFKRARHSLLAKENKAGRKSTAPSCSYAAVEDWCAENEYAQLASRSNFKDYTVYVVKGWIIDSEDKWVGYVVTSEKLMKNLWHLSQSGMQMILCVDTTHRLVAEGHSVFVCGVRDIEQKFHKVAYGVQSNDKTVAANKQMLKMVAQEYLRVKARLRW
jgi:hypothetical protein